MNKIIHSDVLDALLSLSPGTVDCAITSPPYWGQRDYEFKSQIGLEDSYKEYITKSVLIYRNLRNTLKDEGVFFLNIGDKYISKYGNAPLGMIPFKLAYQMKLDGWILEDILIWYKPNHMPSSIKNRFSNTYEPIFVFSKQKNNYYRTHKKLSKHSTVLKIKLQTTPYNHMAVYPEKLVEALLCFGIPKDGVILDPFAGSGTTGKACTNINASSLGEFNLSFIMVEANQNYISIIKKRCSVNKIERFPRSVYYPTSPTTFYEHNQEESGMLRVNKSVSYKPSVYIFNNIKQVENFLKIIQSDEFIGNFQEDGIIYFGGKHFNIETLNYISSLNDQSWVIRNMIVQEVDKRWFPIFFIVKDTKRIKYHFNLDAIRISHRCNDILDWWSTNFVGYNVIDTFRTKNLTDYGKVSKILYFYQDGMPRLLETNWEDGRSEQIPVAHNDYFNKSIKFHCPTCNSEIKHYYHYNSYISCENCSCTLWKSKNTIPKLVVSDKYQIQDFSGYVREQLKVLERTKEYKGKFKDVKKINLGASPGARSSTQEPYFSVQRLYKVYQPMICDYLNIHRIELDLSKSDLTSIFGKDYKHTVGHWLRKDMGGSIPNINDWMKLKEILGLDDQYTRLVCEKGLKFQVVKASHKGKNPGDFHIGSIEDLKEMLVKSYQF